MKEGNRIVHTLWVGEALSRMELLTILSLQRHGHEVTLWTYDSVNNVPPGVTIRDATEVLPASHIFRYNGERLETIPNGGIGSLGHWSDIFQIKLLGMVGGLYSQLDVAYLSPVDPDGEYLFVPYVPFATFLMKCPKGSVFAQRCFDELNRSVNGKTIKRLNWLCTQEIVKARVYHDIPGYERFFLGQDQYLDLGNQFGGPYFEDVPIPKSVLAIHWSNATHLNSKNEPVPGSVYQKLLTVYGL